MTGRLVAEQRVELGSVPAPGSSLAALRAEALSRAAFGAGATHFAPETAASPWPPDRAAGLYAESLASPWAPVDAPAFLVEVLRRDTAAAAIVTTGMDAFGDAPWPDAPRGVFAFRHDWAEPLVERLQWQTSVTRLASGNEARQGLRRVPRRFLTYAVGHARAGDALVADWLADHFGQTARVSAIEQDVLWLAEPLARPASAGSLVMNLVAGRATDPCDLTQWVPGVAGGRVSAEIACARPPEIVPPDPMLDGLPVWPDGNWRDDPSASAQAVLTRQDLSPADPWVRRDDPWPATTYQRRYLAGDMEAIERWRARLWQAQGRLGAFWLPDGLAPVLWVSAEADPEDGFLRVTGEDISAFWHRPAACLILHPDGSRQHALTAICHRDQGGVLVLRSGLDAPVPAGSRVLRLTRCRLDHDAVELYWHSPTLVEIPLTARQLPEPRCNDRSIYMPS